MDGIKLVGADFSFQKTDKELEVMLWDLIREVFKTSGQSTLVINCDLTVGSKKYKGPITIYPENDRNVMSEWTLVSNK